MFKKTVLLTGFVFAGLSACTQPEPIPVGPEPVADKYGALHCPAGYVLQGTSCILVDYAAVDDATGGTTPAPGTDTSGNQNQNQNENQNQNTNENNNQNQSSSD